MMMFKKNNDKNSNFISNIPLIIQNYLQMVIYKNQNIFQIHISDSAKKNLFKTIKNAYNN